MREKVQWGAAFAANGLIYTNDLVEAMNEAFSFLMGVLL